LIELNDILAFGISWVREKGTLGLLCLVIPLCITTRESEREMRKKIFFRLLFSKKKQSKKREKTTTPLTLSLS
jgi:hypothetical protein